MVLQNPLSIHFSGIIFYYATLLWSSQTKTASHIFYCTVYSQLEMLISIFTSHQILDLSRKILNTSFFDKWATINSDENDFYFSSVFLYPLIYLNNSIHFSSFVLQTRISICVSLRSCWGRNFILGCIPALLRPWNSPWLIKFTQLL